MFCVFIHSEDKREGCPFSFWIFIQGAAARKEGPTKLFDPIKRRGLTRKRVEDEEKDYSGCGSGGESVLFHLGITGGRHCWWLEITFCSLVFWSSSKFPEIYTCIMGAEPLPHLVAQRTQRSSRRTLAAAPTRK